MTNEEIHQVVREMRRGDAFSLSYLKHVLMKADAALLEAEGQITTLKSQVNDEQVFLTTTRGLPQAMAAGLLDCHDGTVIRVTDGDRAEYELRGSVWLPRP